MGAKSRKVTLPYRSIVFALAIGVGVIVAVATGAMMMGSDTAAPAAAMSAPPASTSRMSIPDMALTSTDLRGFITGYYALLPADTTTAWSMLGAGYRTKVGGFSSFVGFYDTIAAVRVRDVRVTGADTAAADLVFTRDDGTVSTERYDFTIGTYAGTPVIEDAERVTA